MNKYELVKEDRKQYMWEAPVYRIRYLLDFADIKSGDLGGYIESEKSLSQYSEAIVKDHAIVKDRAIVVGHAIVKDYAEVLDHAMVCGHAVVGNHVTVSGRSTIFADSICEKLNPINIPDLTYNVTITDNNIHIGCKTFKLEQALKLASRWKATKLKYEEAEEIEVEKKIIVEAIKYRLWQLEQLSKEEGE